MGCGVAVGVGAGVTVAVGTGVGVDVGVGRSGVEIDAPPQAANISTRGAKSPAYSCLRWWAVVFHRILDLAFKAAGSLEVLQGRLGCVEGVLGSMEERSPRPYRGGRSETILQQAVQGLLTRDGGGSCRSRGSDNYAGGSQ